LSVQAARIVFPAADREEIAAATAEILTSGTLTLGPYTRMFEAAFAAAHSPSGIAPPHAVAVSSGTAALEISLRAIGVTGRDVIVPANTFFATAEAALRAGGRPVFADIDAETFALSPATLEAALTPQTVAVVVVHIGGLITPHVQELATMCADRGIVLVEDAAHAHGASYDGRFAGSFGVSAGYSFFPTKVVTCGEGGMIVTSSDDVEQQARIYRDQGKAAVTGLVHLRRMAGFIEHRRAVAAQYDAALGRLDGLDPLVEPPGCRTNFYKYIAVLPSGADRAAFKQKLAEDHAVRLAGEVYDLPLHRQPVFAEFAGPSLPVAEDLSARHICLPIHSDMTADEVDQVAGGVAAVYGALVRV
jgi:perosamine synthetase